MILYKFNNTFDTVITPEKRFDVEWSDLVQTFSKHQVSETKNTLAFIAAEFDTSPDARPATRGIKDAQGNVVAELPILDANNKPQPGRYAQNILSIHAICLDSDQGWEIQEAKDLLKGVRHLGYTSWSHGAEGKGTRFRVVLPLSSPCPSDEWSKRHHSIQALFPQVDASFTAKARVMFAPTCPQERLHLAETWNEEGELMDWTQFEPKPELPAHVPVSREGLTTEGQGEIIWETFDMVSFMQDQGLYQRKVGAYKHNVTCPQVHMHSGGEKSGTTMWQDGRSWPVFHCSHGHCSGFKFYEHFRDELGKGWMAPYCQREPEAKRPVNDTPKARLNAILAKYKNKGE